MSNEEAMHALAFRISHMGSCEFGPDGCDGPIQAAHLIPKQALRRRGYGPEVVWDPRNGVAACYRHHRRSDAALERFPVDRLSGDAWAFAADLGLTRLLERYYGRRSDSVGYAA